MTFPHCGEPYLPPYQLRALVAQESTAENSQEDRADQIARQWRRP